MSRTRGAACSESRQQPRPSQTEPAQEHPPGWPTLRASATHPPAAGVQPSVCSARPADWGGDGRVCPRFDFTWCTPWRLPGYFSSDKKINYFCCCCFCFLRERVNQWRTSQVLCFQCLTSLTHLLRKELGSSHVAVEKLTEANTGSSEACLEPQICKKRPDDHWPIKATLH